MGMGLGVTRPIVAILIIGVASLVASTIARADTLEWALVQAYQNNPQLNAQRATLRAQDEAVPQALSGYRPRVALTASVATQNQSTLSKSVGANNAPVYTGSEA